MGAEQAAKVPGLLRQETTEAKGGVGSAADEEAFKAAIRDSAVPESVSCVARNSMIDTMGIYQELEWVS